MPTANDVKLSTRDDLKSTYMQAFRGFSTDPSEIADIINGNVRYARELLGTLVAANLLTQTDSPDGDVWQVVDPGTYDSHTEQEAESVINEWLDLNIPAVNHTAPSTKKGTSTMSTTPKTKPTNSTGKCLCGCGENVAKSNYRPGHDARHAGQVARSIAGSKVTPVQATKALSVLPSSALRLKASAMADRLREKASSTESKAATIKERAAANNETPTSTAKKATAPKPAPAKAPAKPRAARTSTKKATAPAKA